MSKVIRVYDEVWAELQRRARLLEDKNANAVLCMVFDVQREVPVSRKAWG